MKLWCLFLYYLIDEVCRFFNVSEHINDLLFAFAHHSAVTVLNLELVWYVEVKVLIVVLVAALFQSLFIFRSSTLAQLIGLLSLLNYTWSPLNCCLKAIGLILDLLEALCDFFW